MDIAALEAEGFDESTREWRAGSNFISRPGGLRILCELGTGPKRRSELKSALWLDEELLSNRLYAGIRFSIWIKEEVGTDDGGTTEVYTLIDRGERYFQKAREMGVPRAFEKQRESTDTLDAYEESFREDLRQLH